MIDAATIIAVVGDFLAALTVGMTIWVIKYARKTVEEGKRTTAAAKQTTETAERIVNQLTKLLGTAERYRRIYQLRDVGRLAEVIFWKAEDSLGRLTSGHPDHRWRVMEQNYLRQAIVGMGKDLPSSVEDLIGADAAHAKGHAASVRIEIENALKNIEQEQAGLG